MQEFSISGAEACSCLVCESLALGDIEAGVAYLLVDDAAAPTAPIRLKVENASISRA